MKILSFFLTLSCLLYTSVSAQNPCSQATPVKIVVLGSSTAAGTGPSPRDSSWVNRYRDHLQQLNPANQVFNLAVGGFVTYRIMPTGFVPPIVGRPDPDTAHNITKALAEQPDGIIINLPSNDRRYPISEQLANFDSLFRHANNNGVPIWICTTQPISVSGAYQAEVRDSIIAKFSPFVIDFWTTLADTNNIVLPQYAADGVHLNNAGHWILFNRVLQVDLPNLLYQPTSFPDIAMLDMQIATQNRCGDSSATVEVVLANFGSATTSSIDINLESLFPTNNQTYTLNLPNGIGSCHSDTLRFQADLSQRGTYQLRVSHGFSQDSLPANDSIFKNIPLLGYPQLQLIGDTACRGAAVQLQASSDAGDDFLRWFDMAAGGSPIDTGAIFLQNNLSQSTTYYVEAIRGRGKLTNGLTTTTTSNVNWNGAMFDLIAHDTLTIDSLALKIFDLGAQQVNAFYRFGGHLGFETNAGAWTSWGNDSVQAVNRDSLVRVSFSPQTLMPGDTLGVYLYLNNSASRLSYRSNSQPLTVSSPELSIFCGSGASYNFGGNFYPRQWNGRVYYSYGFRPDGACSSARLPVEAVAEDAPQVDLGGDQLGCDSLLLDPNLSPDLRYRWSTGDSASAIWVKQEGVYWLQASNSCGDAIDAAFIELDSGLSVDFAHLYNGAFAVGFTNLTQGGRSFFWDFGDGNTSTSVNPTHTYAARGTYRVSLRAANACDTLTAIYDVDISPLSIDGLEDLPFQLYPNPITYHFLLKNESSPFDAFSFFIYDLQGKKLGEIKPVTQRENEWTFDLRKGGKRLHNLPAGIYLFSVKNEEVRYQMKLLKKIP